MPAIFPVLILNGRPAAGKSELLDYLRKLSDAIRQERFHIGQLIELDDFPMLWTWFEEDDILQNKLNHPRLHSTPDGYFVHSDLWHLLIERLSLEYDKLIRDHPTLHTTHTVLVEFSRGSEHGGYQAAYPHLSTTILQQAAILYIDVSYEESLRKNRKRFNPEKPDSILEHSLSDKKLEHLYKEVDWETLITGNPESIPVHGISVPYGIFSNQDDVTTSPGPVFEKRLESALSKLWKRWTKLHS